MPIRHLDCLSLTRGAPRKNQRRQGQKGVDTEACKSHTHTRWTHTNTHRALPPFNPSNVSCSISVRRRQTRANGHTVEICHDGVLTAVPRIVIGTPDGGKTRHKGWGLGTGVKDIEGRKGGQTEGKTEQEKYTKTDWEEEGRKGGRGGGRHKRAERWGIRNSTIHRPQRERWPAYRDITGINMTSLLQLRHHHSHRGHVMVAQEVGGAQCRVVGLRPLYAQTPMHTSTHSVTHDCLILHTHLLHPFLSKTRMKYKEQSKGKLLSTV